MIKVEQMNDDDCKKLLQRVRYGHLACVRANQPYVVPVHYVYNEPHIYIYTTEGKKTHIIAANPAVCLQVEDVTDDKYWQSVIITGDAVQLTASKEIDHAMGVILATNPSLTPALSLRWMDGVHANITVVYRITPTTITGRTTIDRIKKTN
jgi:nitroimidazol reductase NimA-like FMN-containing flavoprotein (pyridoxamine 5'-phosphate oxidase superfamily)